MYSPDSPPSSLSGFPTTTITSPSCLDNGVDGCGDVFASCPDLGSCSHFTFMCDGDMDAHFVQFEEVICVSSSEPPPSSSGHNAPQTETENTVDGPPTPPESTTSTSSSTSFVCKWRDCDWPGSFDDLVDHIREIHVELQPFSFNGSWDEQGGLPNSSREETNNANNSNSNNTPSTYVCLWEGCKVYGKRSQKRSWLERHVLFHSGDKPFKCIIDNCGSRFKSQSALEKHVNSHFSSSKSTSTTTDTSFCIPSMSQQPSTSSLFPSTSSDANISEIEDVKGIGCTAMMRAKGGSLGTSSIMVNGATPNKHLYSKKKKTRVKRILTRGCCEDYFDSSIMDVIQYQLSRQLMHNQHVTMAKRKLSTVEIQSSVVARRIDNDGNVHLLLRWSPSNILPDEWVPESERESKRTKIVSVPESSVSKTTKEPSCPSVSGVEEFKIPYPPSSLSPSTSSSSSLQKRRRK